MANSTPSPRSEFSLNSGCPDRTFPLIEKAPFFITGVFTNSAEATLNVSQEPGVGGQQVLPLVQVPSECLVLVKVTGLAELCISSPWGDAWT